MISVRIRLESAAVYHHDPNSVRTWPTLPWTPSTSSWTCSFGALLGQPEKYWKRSTSCTWSLLLRTSQNGTPGRGTSEHTSTWPSTPLFGIPNITAMLTDLRREVDSRITTTKQAFSPIPTPFTPYDACGRMRGLHDNYPAPLLRKFVYPRSRSAPPTVDRKRTPQPWFHVSTRNWQSPPSSPDSLQSIHHDRRNWHVCQTPFDSSTMVCQDEKRFFAAFLSRISGLCWPE